jgi:hypothetical protein
MQFISPNELLTALPPVIYERLAPTFKEFASKQAVFFLMSAP